MADPTKMTIKSFSKPDFSGQVGSYTVRVNPESYTQTYSIQYNEDGAVGGANIPLKFDHMPPATISFELWFDATGAIPNSATDLASEITSFQQVVYNYQGGIHEPYYLKVFWGKMSFGARLTSLTVKYTLFKPNGAPLRASADVTFANYIDAKTLAKTEDRESADITHVRVVKAGDTLPLLCDTIYGNSAYYPQVAKANGLTRFRVLRTGTRLVFPPLAK